MNSFYKSIGLYNTITIDLNINSAELIQRLWKVTYKTNTTFISLEKDSSIPTRFEYRGMIDANTFTIKRRARLFDMNRNNPVFHGTISDKNGQSSVSVEFFPSGFQIFNWVMILCFCLIMISVNIQGDQRDLMFAGVALVIAVAQYFILKRGISRGKYEFERELIYIAQKP
ncbi:hypothetical protein FW781_06585 (plasmid) [Chryseobacterium panacisoli]|uniref:Uncharacterized protein n=1 Tax=Chryseobacterium panacisoli TaxID=1807141 RepID=A0A5D8ZXZ3_9FLAO|nr:hypothetical protein [Chryseobacterium panacisoli]TZF99589.1 hypothetical protein FW781_06585 [Chryseobacterium panacisoli]